MILLSGATGKTGRCLAQLIADRNLPARAIVRDPDKAEALAGRGLEVVVGDLGDPAVLTRAMEGVERALLLTANTPRQLDQELRFIDAAESAGVAHVVKMSAIGADSGSDAVLKHFHGTAEDRLRRAALAQKLAYTLVQPNFFMDNLLNAAPSIARGGRFQLPMGSGRVGAIDVRDVAEVLLATLTRPGHENCSYLITGPELLSFADMADTFSAVLDREIAYVDTPPEEFRRQMIAMGVPEWNVDAMLQLFALIRLDRSAEVTGTVETVTGKAPRPFREFVRDHAERFG